MPWDLQDDRPVYLQLMEQIELRILSGAYRAGDRLPAVRELAAEASVNANTMQRALAELEQAELVHAQRTAGRFITEDQTQIDRLRLQFAHARALEYLSAMAQLGYAPEQARALLETIKKEA